MSLIRTETTRSDRYGPPVYEIELTEATDRGRTTIGRITAVGDQITVESDVVTSAYLYPGNVRAEVEFQVELLEIIHQQEEQPVA